MSRIDLKDTSLGKIGSKKIAIVGSGISGLTSAWLLSQQHQLTVFEANDYLGGHTATVDIQLKGKTLAVDTGFIVFNDRTYPNFERLLARIGVKAKPTEMSFSVQQQQTGLEYNGHTLGSMFAQRSNLFSLKFYGLLAEIVRFNLLCKKILKEEALNNTDTLGDFLEQYGFSEFFTGHYILPMVAAIWSSSLADSRDFPLAFFLRFFNHHGLLNLIDRPQWYVVEGGSRSYIPGLTAPLTDIRLNTPVLGIRRHEQGVTITTATGSEDFDEVVLACHSDQALRMLTDATEVERAVLGGLEYRDNEVILHTDTRLLPKEPRAWASWNYWLDGSADALPAVTYNMNILQGIQSEQTLCVTLNRGDAIAPEHILRRFSYAHPVYNQAAITAQARRAEICGQQHTHFCGAYWYNGFHEDGVNSALDVCARFGISL
ncbi:FAD-dependent oxidoreductase [Oceanisphaera profunda]|uniref:FAD-dependent oxidoreductase n=1 Tax=Oceanisphaera profunda TaxID=1416627 RepID=A0A1Y0D8V4_9GAMM|nr:FAD-dependent oxidoreductase [Oceanisphaera profunda]ART83546.1 FAD-dependent oxidoreductase [Oceanisphaera profunda]